MKHGGDDAKEERGAAEERERRLAALDRHVLERDRAFHAALIDEASGPLQARVAAARSTAPATERLATGRFRAAARGAARAKPPPP